MNEVSSKNMIYFSTACDPMSFPRTLYISLWFPLSSETFVFYEVDALVKHDLPVAVLTLYGDKTANLADHMRHADIPVERLGVVALGRILGAAWRRLWSEPGKTLYVLRNIFFRRWRDAEMRLENAWAGIAGFPCRELVVVCGC